MGERRGKSFSRMKIIIKWIWFINQPQPPKTAVICDACPYGVGAVLSHQIPDRSEKPIMFESRTLSKAKKKYSQLKEK